MKMHRRPRAQVARTLRQQMQADIDPARRRQRSGLDEPIAAGNVTSLDTGEIQSAALPGTANLGRTALRMNASHAHFATRGHHDERFTHMDPPRESSACD